MTIGGAEVAVEYTNEGEGVLQIFGQIESFSIAGETLWIDHLCKAASSTAAPSPGHTVTVGLGQSVRNVNFGNMRLGEIHGLKWNDLNDNSERDEGEPGLPGWTIYLDLNRNGQWDEDEPSQVTDENGEYWFTNLKPGRYTVGEVLQSGWEQTYPSPQNSVDVFLFNELNPTALYFNGDSFTTVAEAGSVANVTIGSFTNSNGGVTTEGFVYPDSLDVSPPNQVLSFNNATANFTFEEILTGLAFIYDDGGGNENFIINGDLRNVNSLVALNNTVVGGVLIQVTQVSDLVGIVQAFGAIESFGIGGQEFSIDNLVIFGQPIPGSGVHVVDVGGEVIRGVDFGNRELLGKIHGTKFIDNNGDGVRGPNDRPILGWEIYIDENDNGMYDKGEPLTSTDRSGDYWFMNLEPGTYIVREVEADGWTQTSPRTTFDATHYEAGDLPAAVVQGDINGDEIVDLVVADYSGEALQILLGLGDGTFDSPITLPLGGGAYDLTLVDLDGDLDLDIVAVLVNSDAIVVLYNDGDGTFPTTATYPTGDTPTGVVAGDFDGVNGPDVAVANLLGDSITIFLNNGAGAFDETLVLNDGAVAFRSGGGGFQSRWAPRSGRPGRRRQRNQFLSERRLRRAFIQSGNQSFGSRGIVQVRRQRLRSGR